MKTNVTNWEAVEAESMGEAVPGVFRRILIGPAEGAPNFILRHFTVERGCSSPQHVHDWEHEAYILSGRGVLVNPDGEEPFGPGDAVYVAPQVKHQFRNVGDEALTFLCIIPKSGH